MPVIHRFLGKKERIDTVAVSWKDYKEVKPCESGNYWILLPEGKPKIGCWLDWAKRFDLDNKAVIRWAEIEYPDRPYGL